MFFVFYVQFYLSPLDLTVNMSIKLKQFESQEFSEYYAQTVSNSLASNPDMDMGDISIDTRRTIVRPMHARSLTKVYNMFKTESGERIINNGWKAAGIVDAVKDCRSQANIEDIVDPFSTLRL